MLNEIWRLLQGLERNKIERMHKHKRIQVPGRTAPCVRVCISEDGKINSIQDISDEEWPTWTVMEGNQNSFPVVRIQEPLYRLQRGHERWTILGYKSNGRRSHPPSVDTRLNVLEDILKNAETRPLSKKTQTLWRRLRDQKAKELSVCVENDQQLRSVDLLARSFIQSDKSPENIMRQVADDAIKRIRQGRLQNIDFVEQLIVGNGPPNPQDKFPVMTVQLAFDIENAGNNSLQIYSSAIRNRLIEKLPQDPSWKRISRKHILPEQQDIDAFSGKPEFLEKKTFPKVDLPVPSVKAKNGRIGRKRFPLFSMFSAARCNTRYKLSDTKVFPLSKVRAIQLKEALEEITADNRREKTWQYVDSGRFGMQGGKKIRKPDLLIAYVEEKSMLDIKTAGYFGQGQNITETKFEVDAATVCEAFRGIVREKPQSKLNLFLIREVSKGQLKLVLAASPTINEVIVAAENWQKAVKENVPDVTLYLPPLKTFDKKDIPEIRDARPWAPYPDQVVRLLSYQWMRDGASPKGKDGKPQIAYQPIFGPGLSDVIALMLRMEGKWEPICRNLLNLLIRRVGALLIGLFSAKHAFGPRQSQGRPEPLFDYPRLSRETALRAVAILGILLDALASRKESYMKEALYQIGQILSLADTLHKDYCIVVRNGQMPNSLIGTSLMRRALDNPAGALADLSERIIEYIRWAKVAQISTEWPQGDPKTIAVNEARKKMRQYGTIAADLGSIDLPTECTDVMSAHLLLGFLANQPDEN